MVENHAKAIDAKRLLSNEGAQRREVNLLSRSSDSAAEKTTAVRVAQRSRLIGKREALAGRPSGEPQGTMLVFSVIAQKKRQEAPAEGMRWGTDGERANAGQRCRHMRSMNEGAPDVRRPAADAAPSFAPLTGCCPSTRPRHTRGVHFISPSMADPPRRQPLPAHVPSSSSATWGQPDTLMPRSSTGQNGGDSLFSCS